MNETHYNLIIYTLINEKQFDHLHMNEWMNDRQFDHLTWTNEWMNKWTIYNMIIYTWMNDNLII